nr:MAG TPA: hypothetical protein [Caudoviricetes sp.]DAT92739.1 MAG TPA: hypothetical protein [Caudoviricetes sp.]DAY00603.1 MAG TPA: hypothetical protein [Caudoviricetes sp.]
MVNLKSVIKLSLTTENHQTAPFGRFFAGPKIKKSHHF